MILVSTGNYGKTFFFWLSVECLFEGSGGRAIMATRVTATRTHLILYTFCLQLVSVLLLFNNSTHTYIHIYIHTHICDPWTSHCWNHLGLVSSPPWIFLFFAFIYTGCVLTRYPFSATIFEDCAIPQISLFLKNAFLPQMFRLIFFYPHYIQFFYGIFFISFIKVFCWVRNSFELFRL